MLYEAERLVKAGVKELLVISQDTSAYGVDLKYAASKWHGEEVRARFFDLVKNLGSLGAWVRLHYVYPYPHVDEVVELMASGTVLPYLDIPFQHAAPAVLRAMRRPAGGEKTLDRIAKWRDVCPDLAIRSTFIVGFPGETNEDFELLLAWLKEARIDRAGCFKYEAVTGARANELGAHVPEEVKEERWHRFMAAQAEVSAEIMGARVGRETDVLVDAIDHEAGEAVGRAKWDAPEIDGNVYVASRRPLRAGDIVTVKIERADAYDLHGVAV